MPRRRRPAAPVPPVQPVQPTPVSRRRLLQAAGAVAAFTIIPGGLVRGFAANEKVNVGIIGVNGMGRGNRQWLARDGANIVALCDVDDKSLAEAAKEHAGARPWNDFREMLEKQKEIDAVMVSTADHVHAVASMRAMRLGKHVCTEKPLCHNVLEARALAEAATKYKVATQLDNEAHATAGLRTCVDWVRGGLIGTVREVHIWSDRPIWPQGIAQRPASKPVPPQLHWDLWIGPAPYRDYHESLHPFKWRGWWDFGCGALGDMGCHFFDPAVWALDLHHPTTIEAEHEGNSAETGPKWSIVTYQFPARGERPAVTVKWYDGGKLPPRPDELEPGRKLPTNGSLYVGDTGKILVTDASSPRLIPEERMKGATRPARVLPVSPGHKLEWLAAIRGGTPALSNFPDYGSRLSEIVLLGNVAIRAGKKIEWDGPGMKAVGAPDVDQYLKREYRKGWEL